MLPSRPPGSVNPPPAAKRSGTVAFPQPSYDAIKKRVAAKLKDRLDTSASKRMPQSLLRQSLRQHAEQITEQEVRGLSRAERDRLIEELLADFLGYGPLEELFCDAAVREIMVTGPGTVIARREQAHWLPTSVKFRDEAHVRSILDKMAAHADAVGPVMTTVAAFDLKLPNGFRVLALVPPDALDQHAMATFVRERPAPATPADTPNTQTNASASAGTKSVPGSENASPRVPGSGLITTPAPRPSSPDLSATSAHDPLTRYRSRIIERLLNKFASMGLYDVSRLEVHELQRIISAYVGEYAEAEKIYLSDTDQGRLTLEILTSLRR